MPPVPPPPPPGMSAWYGSWSPRGQENVGARSPGGQYPGFQHRRMSEDPQRPTGLQPSTLDLNAVAIETKEVKKPVCVEEKCAVSLSSKDPEAAADTNPQERISELAGADESPGDEAAKPKEDFIVLDSQGARKESLPGRKNSLDSSGKRKSSTGSLPGSVATTRKKGKQVRNPIVSIGLHVLTCICILSLNRLQSQRSSTRA